MKEQGALFKIPEQAIFSPCKKYRFRLERRWSKEPGVLCIMLNPSSGKKEISLNDTDRTRPKGL